jgi:hypothetical protein
MLRGKKFIIDSFTILMFGILSISCKTSFVSLKIENYKPAPEELADDIQSLTLMNRSMNNQFSNFNNDSLQNYFYHNNFQLSKIILDSVACDTTLKALAALLYESGRYDVVIPVERNIKRSEPFYQLPDTLSEARVNRICSEYNTDALMVLDRFSTKVMADYSAAKEQQYGMDPAISRYATLDLNYYAYFRIYQAGHHGVVKTIEVNDTIYWESSDYTIYGLFNALPSVKQALISAGIKIALDVADRISPNWIPADRGYFIFDKKNDPGQQFMKDNRVAEAEKYWSALANSNNKRIRSKAEFNMALANELNGNLDSAIQWGLKSYYTMYRHQTETYLKKLQARKQTLERQEKTR